MDPPTSQPPSPCATLLDMDWTRLAARILGTAAAGALTTFTTAYANGIPPKVAAQTAAAAAITTVLGYLKQSPVTPSA